jgi:hypothetical protein
MAERANWIPDQVRYDKFVRLCMTHLAVIPGEDPGSMLGGLMAKKIAR